MKHSVFIWTAIASCLLFSVSCNKDSNSENQDEDKIEEASGSDWTATKEVKTKIITVGSNNDNGGILYQDFTFRYDLSFYMSPEIWPYKRSGSGFSNGAWADWALKGYGIVVGKHAGVVSLGPVSSITDITQKETKDYAGGRGTKEFQSPHWEKAYFIGDNFVPNSGYYMYYRKENDELAFIRLFVSSYTADKNGQITSVTIQYQLY